MHWLPCASSPAPIHKQLKVKEPRCVAGGSPLSSAGWGTQPDQSRLLWVAFLGWGVVQREVRSRLWGACRSGCHSQLGHVVNRLLEVGGVLVEMALRE
jgi:hypothetical protein